MNVWDIFLLIIKTYHGEEILRKEHTNLERYFHFKIDITS